MWTIEKITETLNQLCANDGLEPITIPVKINGRLTRTLGKVTFEMPAYKPISIEFAKRLIENDSESDIINTIKHEYVHYFLLVTEKCNHGHDHAFRMKCLNIGCTHIGAQNEVSLPKKEQFKYEVWCDGCGEMIATYSRKGKTLNSIDRCSCGICGAKALRVVQNW